MYYFLNQQRTLCHILENDEEGYAPHPCDAEANKRDLMNYQLGEPNGILLDKPADIPLCKRCEKAMVSMRDA
jgi:hypothetical protein